MLRFISNSWFAVFIKEQFPQQWTRGHHKSNVLSEQKRFLFIFVKQGTRAKKNGLLIAFSLLLWKVYLIKMQHEKKTLPVSLLNSHVQAETWKWLFNLNKKKGDNRKDLCKMNSWKMWNVGGLISAGEFPSVDHLLEYQPYYCESVEINSSELLECNFFSVIRATTVIKIKFSFSSPFVMWKWRISQKKLIQR